MGRDGLYQGCTGQPFFESGQKKKNRGGAGRDRAGSKILVAGRGRSNPTRAFSGWDKRPYTNKFRSVSFLNKCELFCLFFNPPPGALS